MLVKEKYIDYLEKVEAILKENELPYKKSKELKEVISSSKLLIPVIGAFSAGKSTLLNSFLGKDVLLTGIVPETAIATELYFSENERVEIIMNNNEVKTFSLNDLEEIKSMASCVKFSKVYVNSPNLKNIEPLILVDMPGFESPYDEHNKAIFTYINKGAHYILLTSVEEGTITRSMLRHIHNIQEYGRDFSFFLSKSNLRSGSEIKEISKKIEEQIDEYLLLGKEVTPIYKDGGENLKIILNKINPEALFKSLFEKDIKNNFIENNSSISLLEKSLLNSLNENSEIIENLKESLIKIEKKKELLVKEAKRKYSERNIGRIIDSVGISISNSKDELVRIGMAGNEKIFKDTLVDIIKNSLISETKYSLTDISESILNEFKIDLISNESFNIDSDFYEKIIFSIKEQLNSTTNWFKNSEDLLKSNSVGNSIYKIGTTILGITTNIISPILEILIIFLPNIMSFFSRANKEKKQREILEQKVISEVIPNVKKKVREEITTILEKEVERMIKEIGEKIEEEINEKKELIEKLEKEREEKNIKIEEILEKIKKSKEEILIKYNNIL